MLPLHPRLNIICSWRCNGTQQLRQFQRLKRRISQGYCTRNRRSPYTSPSRPEEEYVFLISLDPVSLELSYLIQLYHALTQTRYHFILVSSHVWIESNRVGYWVWGVGCRVSERHRGISSYPLCLCGESVGVHQLGQRQCQAFLRALRVSVVNPVIKSSFLSKRGHPSLG